MKQSKKVTLFGSRARKEAQKYSDFDICIFCGDKETYYHLFDDIDEMSTFYQFDIVNYEMIRDIKFLENINAEGVVIYDRG